MDTEQIAAAQHGNKVVKKGLTISVRTVDQDEADEAVAKAVGFLQSLQDANFQKAKALRADTIFIRSPAEAARYLGHTQIIADLTFYVHTEDKEEADAKATMFLESLKDPNLEVTQELRSNGIFLSSWNTRADR